MKLKTKSLTHRKKYKIFFNVCLIELSHIEINPQNFNFNFKFIEKFHIDICHIEFHHYSHLFSIYLEMTAKQIKFAHFLSIMLIYLDVEFHHISFQIHYYSLE